VHAGEFTVDVELDGVHGSRNVAGLLKPLLDGLVSALQVHRPAPAQAEDRVRSRLALLGDPPEPWTLLTDDSVSVLGARSLVRAGKTNLVWNPGDDRCSAVSVIARAATTPRIAATVHAVPE